MGKMILDETLWKDVSYILIRVGSQVIEQYCSMIQLNKIVCIYLYVYIEKSKRMFIKS